MIKKYTNILDDSLIKTISNYLNDALKVGVWGSNNGWEQNVLLNSSSILTHEIKDKKLCKKIKTSVENTIKFNFEENDLEFNCFIYFFSGGCYIPWHTDNLHSYGGTIYLTEEWDSSDGGIFLYIDNHTNEIKGILPTYNTMIVNTSIENDPHNLHCVTCIVPGTIKKRVTIVWRSDKISTNKKTKILYL